MESVDGPQGEALWRRAESVLPLGGIYFTRSAQFAGAGVQPGFLVSAEGCRVEDVDGRRYIDFLCANGPILLGYRHPEVEAAAAEQAGRAESVSYFNPALVELAERLVERTPGMAWAIPTKNGSDAVALGVRIARQQTGRSKLLLFERAYHGFAPELSLASAGVPDAVRAGVVRAAWNDVEGLARAVADIGSDLAAIVLNPLDQNPGLDTQPATDEFVAGIEQVREQTRAQLVLDDVRAGFRLHPGGSHRELGVEPDLICLGKALGNGHAVSALLGSETLRPAARKIPYTATFMFTAVAQTAAVRTLEIYDRDHAFDSIRAAGERLCSGLTEAAAKTGHSVQLSGPPSMPSLRFLDDEGFARGRRFSREAAQRGALFHPLLNWFLNAAHREADIDEAISIADEAFRATPPG